MKTFILRQEDVERRWYHVDATDCVLGRLATRVARLLMGKDDPVWTPWTDSGHHVVVTNAEKVYVSGAKRWKKVYRHHTGWVGGLVERGFDEVQSKKPERIVELAVRRMLPKTRQGRRMLQRLKVYAGPDHPHVGQKPQTIEVPRGTPRGRGQETTG